MKNILLGLSIVCVMIFIVSFSLIILYGTDTFDFTNESYNDQTIMILGAVSAFSAVGACVFGMKWSETSPSTIKYTPIQNKNPTETQTYRASQATQTSYNDEQPSMSAPPPLSAPPTNQTQTNIMYDVSKIPPPMQQQREYQALPTPPPMPSSSHTAAKKWPQVQT